MFAKQQLMLNQFFYKKLLTKQAEVDIILNVAVEQQLITF
jgi:hypothetical protein